MGLCACVFRGCPLQGGLKSKDIFCRDLIQKKTQFAVAVSHSGSLAGRTFVSRPNGTEHQKLPQWLTFTSTCVGRDIRDSLFMEWIG